mgnify:CR=1 FL=1
MQIYSYLDCIPNFIKHKLMSGHHNEQANLHQSKLGIS